MKREMRRKDREIDTERAYGILRDSEYGLLATVSEDGSPYCIPVSHAVDGYSIYFHCAKEGHKLDNIIRDNRVCLTAVGKTRVLPEKFSMEYESAVAFGRVEILQDRDQKLAAALAICRKYTPELMTEAEAYALRAMDETNFCKITVDHITGKARTAK